MTHNGTTDKPLLAEFTPNTYTDWRRQAEEQLEGASFDKKLVTETAEGIAIQPIYDKSNQKQIPGSFPGEGNYARGINPTGYRAKPWEISQQISLFSLTEINHCLRHDLARGQTSIHIATDTATRAGSDPDKAEGDVFTRGVSLSTPKDLSQLFENIPLTTQPIWLRAGSAGVPLLALYVAHVQAQNVRPMQLQGGVLSDPVIDLALTGSSRGIEKSLDTLAAAFAWARNNAAGDFALIGIETEPYQNAGGSAVEELALAIATGAFYLRSLSRNGTDIQEVAHRTVLLFAQGPQFFMEVAKLRAARVLWAQVCNAFGVQSEHARARILTRTAQYNTTLFDPYVNLLRTTTESFSAVVGGAQSLHTGTFDELLSEPDEFSRRIARNTQVILQQECNLADVIDPAGGSYAVETLTTELCEKAWTLFQEIERAGGVVSALRSAIPQSRLKKVAEGRRKKLTQRRDVLVGTNMYANIREAASKRPAPDRKKAVKRRTSEVSSYRNSADHTKDKAVMQLLQDLVSGKEPLPTAIAAAKAGATLGELTTALCGENIAADSCEPLALHRLAEPYEKLRTASLSYQAKHGKLPQVFLCAMGALRQHKARADFCQGFFEVGGFEVLYSNGFATPEDASKAFAASGAKIAVICSTDETYPQIVPALAPMLKRAVPDCAVLLAGSPGDNEASFRSAGMDDYIFVKSNNHDVLSTYLTKLGAL